MPTLRLVVSARCVALAGCLCALGGCSPTFTSPADDDILASIATQGESPQPVNQWPGWRGGAAHGVTSYTLPTHWDRNRGVQWVVDVPGRGNSSPVVWDDRILLTSTIGSGDDAQAAVLCFDRTSGELLWKRTVGATHGATHGKNGYASATVATDGQRVVASFGDLGLVCFDLDGNRQWHERLAPMQHKWGSASSPVLLGNLVVQLCDNEGGSFIAAVNKHTGQGVWRTQRNSAGCWTTPVVVQVGDDPGRFELVVNGTSSSDGSDGMIIAYDPANGEPLWRVRGTTDIPCPTMIVGDGLLVSSSGGNGPVIAIRPGGRGEATDSAVVWRQPVGGPYVPTGVVHRGMLFMVADGGVASAWRLQDGTPLWSKRLRGTFSASLLAAGDHVYAVSEQGTVYVLAADAEFKLIAANRLAEPCLATPAPIEGALILRTETQLWCIVGDEPQRVAEVPADTSPESPSDAPTVPVSIPAPPDADVR